MYCALGPICWESLGNISVSSAESSVHKEQNKLNHKGEARGVATRRVSKKYEEMATVCNSSGGFEYQFVNSLPDIFVCKICHLPSRDPHLTVCCGHVFCKPCLDGMKEAKSLVNIICPMCRSEEFVTFPNKQIDREVKSLHVYCTNKDRGCEWQGEVNCIDNHLTRDDGCEYEDVICTSGCGRVTQRRDLTKHVEMDCPRRKVNCQYCRLEGEHQFIEGRHKEVCVEYPLACPNNCEEVMSIHRKDMNNHKRICPLEMIDCEYHTVGCEVRMTRQMQHEHNKNKMEDHLRLTKSKLEEATCRLDNNKSKLDETIAKFNETVSKLNDTSLALHESKNELVRVHSQLDETSSKLKGTQQELFSTKFQLNILEAKFDDKISSLEQLIHQHNWSLQVLSVAHVSLPGKEVLPVTFKITGFIMKKKAKKEWYSDPFYTNIKGYKMCLRIDANGFSEGEGTHCSTTLSLMRGEYDDGVHWPLNMKLKITLLNQLRDDEHETHLLRFSEVAHDKDVTHRVLIGDKAPSGWGIPCFISHRYLTEATPTRQFLKDDCIFISISRP